MVNDLGLYAAGTLLAGTRPKSTRNLRVVKGIELPDFATTGNRFRLECRLDRNARVVKVKVLDLAGTVYYTLDVPCEDSAGEITPPERIDSSRKDWKPASGKIYDGRLFHGSDLQVIEALDKLGEDGGSGILRSKCSGNIGAFAPVDVLDGGLQLAGLWIHEFRQQDALPTSLENCSFNPDWKREEPVCCEIICENKAQMAYKWNVYYRSALSGEMLGVLKGVKAISCRYLTRKSKADPPDFVCRLISGPTQ
jgi:hypothetical protein